MKIGFVILGIKNGGLERRTVNIVNELSNNKKNKIFLITAMEQVNEYKLVEAVLRVQILKNNLMQDTKILNEFVRNNNIDILVGMGIYANWIVCMVRFCINCKVIVVEANDPRHDHISWKSKVLRKLLYWKSDGYIFQTEEEKNFYSKKIQKRAVVIHNPVKTDLPKREKKRRCEVVAIGRILPQKNYQMLLKAFQMVHAKYPKYRLRIFGQGSELDKLQKLSLELNISHVVDFEGFSLNVHEKIVASDIYVLSSDFEGMPNALLEAMAMGFPVVSTDCGGGGPRELITDGMNGLLVPVNNEVVLAEKICWLIEHDSEKERMAQNAYKVRKTHELQGIGKKWEKYIESVL